MVIPSIRDPTWFPIVGGHLLTIQRGSLMSLSPPPKKVTIVRSQNSRVARSKESFDLSIEPQKKTGRIPLRVVISSPNNWVLVVFHPLYTLNNDFFIAQLNQMDGFCWNTSNGICWLHPVRIIHGWFWLELHLDQFKYINANHIWRGWLVDSCPFFCLKNSIHPTFLVHSQFLKPKWWIPNSC